MSSLARVIGVIFILVGLGGCAVSNGAPGQAVGSILILTGAVILTGIGIYDELVRIRDVLTARLPSPWADKPVDK